MIEPYAKLATICRQNGLALDQDQLGLLRRFVDMLVDWNSRINLISRADMENVWFSHVLHSISPLFFIHIHQGVKILDLGSGGGLPGIPLAIARKDLMITCLDSIRKKTTALENIIENLALTNASVVTGRAENLNNRDKGFDVIIARAVAHLTDLIKWSRSVISRTGTGERISVGDEPLMRRRKIFRYPFLMAMKGGDLQSEIETAKIKTGEKRISSVDIVFDGSIEIGLEEKKIVVVEF